MGEIFLVNHGRKNSNQVMENETYYLSTMKKFRLNCSVNSKDMEMYGITAADFINDVADCLQGL